MVRDPDTVWIGLEYFCNEGDELWTMSDAEMIELGAATSWHSIGIIDAGRRARRHRASACRRPTRPTSARYDRFDEIRAATSIGFENLFLVGRNGMHRYNNQDHSMLTAMMAVDNIVAGVRDKTEIWDVNTETSTTRKRIDPPAGGQSSSPNRSPRRPGPISTGVVRSTEFSAVQHRIHREWLVYERNSA